MITRNTKFLLWTITLLLMYNSFIQCYWYRVLISVSIYRVSNAMLQCEFALHKTSEVPKGTGGSVVGGQVLGWAGKTAVCATRKCGVTRKLITSTCLTSVNCVKRLIRDTRILVHDGHGQHLITSQNASRYSTLNHLCIYVVGTIKPIVH